MIIIQLKILMQQSKQESKDQKYKYQILLIKDIHYQNQQDYEDILNSFNPVDYLSNACLVRVYERTFKNVKFQYIKNAEDYVNIQVQETKRVPDYPQNPKKKLLLVQQLYYDVFKIQPDKKKQHLTNLTKLKIKIDFSQKQQQIVIKINGTESWLEKDLAKNIQMIETIRMPPNIKLQQNKISYFYREGCNTYNKTSNKPHQFLAFGHGGIEGIGFVGIMDILSQQFSLKQLDKKQSSIKSIIGSQLGGLVGLAIVCNYSQQKLKKQLLTQFLNFDNDSKQKKYSNKKQISQNLKELLQHLFDIKNNTWLDNLVKDPQKQQQIQQNILSLLKQLHPFLRKLEKQQNLIQIIDRTQKKATIISEISLIIIKDWLDKQTNKPNQLTLSQLYKMTQVQLTYTALDLTNCILRFLNHKTCPDLPVCEAVRISSTSLFSLRKVKWQQKWGKYYVHYNMSRTQINLSGCEFTSGGEVIPYPINYLNDHIVQTVYFSHTANSHTKIIGFYLDKSHKAYQNSYLPHKQKIQQALRDLSKSFKNILENKQSQDILYFGKIILKKLENIVNSFLYSVHHLSVEYCAQRTITIQYTDYKTPKKIVGSQIKLNIQNIAKLKQNSITKNIKSLLKITQSKKSTQEDILQCIKVIKQIVVSYCSQQKLFLGELKQKEKKKQKQNDQKQQMKNSEQSILQVILRSGIKSKKLQGLINQQKVKDKIIYQLLNHNEKYTDGKIVNNIQRLDHLRKDTLFWGNDIQKSKTEIRQIASVLLKFFEISDNNDRDIIVQRIKDKQLRIIENIIENKNYQIKNWKNKKDKTLSNDLTIKILNINRLIYVINRQTIDRDLEEMCQSIGQQTFINYQFDKQQRKLRNFVEEFLISKKMILTSSQRKRKNIHLVVESAPYSHLYFIPFIESLEDSLLFHSQKQQSLLKDRNDKLSKINVNISSITASGFNAVSALLYVSDISSIQLRKKAYELVGHFKISEWQQFYEKFEWAIISQDKIFQDINNVFKDIAKFLEESTGYFVQSQSIDDEKTYIWMIKNKKDNCLMRLNQLYESIKLCKGKQKQKLIKRLKTCKQINNKDNKKIQEWEKLKKPLETFIKYFQSDINDLLKNSTYMHEYFSYLSKIYSSQESLQNNEHNCLFKFLLSCQMLHTTNIRKYINSILDLMELNHDINLEEFYISSKKKIHLNFSVFDINSGTVMFINHMTKPKMPVWSAILASLSLPSFFQPFVDKEEWTYLNIKHESIYMAKSQFLSRMQEPNKEKDKVQKQKQKQKKLCSGDFLNKFPMELLSNQYMRELNTSRENYDETTRQQFICLSFQSSLKGKLQQQEKRQQKQKQKQNKIKYMNKEDKVQLLELLNYENWQKYQFHKSIVQLFPKISNNNSNLFRNLYDSRSCPIKSLHYIQIYNQLLKQSQSNAIKNQSFTNSMNLSLNKAKGEVKKYLLNHCKIQQHLSLILRQKYIQTQKKYQYTWTLQEDYLELALEAALDLDKKQGSIKQKKNRQKDTFKFQLVTEEENKRNYTQNQDQIKIGKQIQASKLFLIKIKYTIDKKLEYIHTIKFNKFKYQKAAKEYKASRHPQQMSNQQNKNKQQFCLYFDILCNPPDSDWRKLFPQNYKKQPQDYLLVDSKVPKFLFFSIRPTEKNKDQITIQLLYDNNYGEMVNIRQKIIAKWGSQKEDKKDEVSNFWKNVDQRTITLPKKWSEIDHHRLFLHVKFLEKAQIAELSVQQSIKEQKLSYQFHCYTHELILENVQFDNQTKEYICSIQYNKLQGNTPVNVQIPQYFNKENLNLSIQSKIRDLQVLRQEYLMCPKCFISTSKSAQKGNHQKALCYCCKKQQKNIIWKCTNTECNGTICASCLYKFKDDDDDPYTCPNCDTTLKTENMVSKCEGEKCGLINKWHFVDTKCKYSFCQQCFENVTRHHR